MGYDTHMSGQIKIAPRLPNNVLDKLGLDPDNGDGTLMAFQAGDEDTVALVNGQIAVVPGNSWTTIESRSDGEPVRDGGDDAFGSLGKIAKQVTKTGSTATGAIYLDGEDSTDLGRIRIENGKAVHETPELVWPNGDKGWGV